MAAHTVEPGTECPEGHGEEWLMKWDGSRADYLCCVCQKFFDVEPRAKVLVGDEL